MPPLPDPLAAQESPGTDAAVPPRPGRRRMRVVVAAVTLVLVVAAGGGWAMASSFISPAQREAAARPPEPGAITAEVTQGDLARTISAQSLVSRQSGISVVLPVQEGTSVVTGSDRPVGSELKAGDVALEVNGRPLVAVSGQFPFYRDLRLGDSGPDVGQLQSALVSAGYSLRQDSTVGASTMTAYTGLLKARGYSPPTETPVQAPSATDEVSADAEAETQRQETPTAPVPYIDTSELLVLNGLPGAIAATPPVGTTLGADTQITIEQGALVAAAEVAVDVAAQIQPGMTATLRGTDGVEVAARVDAVTQPTGDATNASVRLVSASDPLPESWRASSPLALIVIENAAADSLLVPSRAVATGGDASARVLVEQTDGTFKETPVEELGVLAGQSAVRPVTPGALAVGDEVRIG